MLRRKAAMAVVGVTIALLTTGCFERVADLVDQIDGFFIGQRCEIDAMFSVHNCKIRGKLHRKSSSTTGLDPDAASIIITGPSGSVVSLPSASQLFVERNGQVIASTSFSLQAISATELKFADANGVKAWITSNSASGDDIAYELSDALIPTIIGTNTITAETRVLGETVAATSYSTYVPRYITPEQ